MLIFYWGEDMANSSSFTINIKALFDAGSVKNGINDL